MKYFENVFKFFKNYLPNYLSRDQEQNTEKICLGRRRGLDYDHKGRKIITVEERDELRKRAQYTPDLDKMLELVN